MIWRTDKPKGSPIVVYRNGNPRPEVLFLATKPYPHYYDDGGEEIPGGMIQKWASLEESSLPSNLEEAAEEFADREYMVGYVDRSALYKGFWHGAKWDREQMMKEHIPKEHSELTELEYALYDLLASNNITNHSDEEVVETAKVAAMDLMNIAKAEMMKESVEVEITKDNRGNNVIRAGVFNKDFEYGDRARIIIVKED